MILAADAGDAGTTLEFVFVAGRYHATPWGSHVNEGLVEWPPSPWRLLRALVATGYSRLGWTSIEGDARVLLERLAAAPPDYLLPDAVASHTRHYMPIPGDNTTKVLDTFMHVRRGSALVVRFATELSPPCRDLLARLLNALPYLGRAEAWVQARLLADAPTSDAWMVAGERPPGPGHERVELLAPDADAAYATWRSRYVAQTLERAEAKARARAEAGGKAFKGLSKKELAEIEGRLPPDVIHALLQDTGALRAAGWSQPPGTRFIAYHRPAPRVTPRGETAHRVAVREPTAALLALASDTVHADLGPPMRNAVRFTDAIHKTLARAMDGATDAAASWLSGRRADGTVIEGHRHASLIPLALGRRQGRIDHLLVHCPMGLHPDARDALARLRVAFAKDLPRLFVTLVGLGEVGDFADTVPLVRPATVLRSATPFVPARFLKNRGRDTLVEQVQRELAYRSLPPATRVELEVGLDGGRFVAADRARIGARAAALVVDGGDALTQPAPRFRHFVQERGTHRPPARLSLSLRIELAEPATGPVALGYGSHFGLGLFEPERG